VEDLTNNDIAGVLGISEPVENYLRTIFDKPGVRTWLKLAL
jgi:DNA-binding CsgD family transcriptional regulator